MHEGLHKVHGSATYSFCGRLAQSRALPVSSRAKAVTAVAAPKTDRHGRQPLCGDANQTDLRHLVSSKGRNGGREAERSDRRSDNVSALQPAVGSSAAPVKPRHKRMKRDITVLVTREGSWQAHRKILPQFTYRDMQQLCRSNRASGLCTLEKPNYILTRIDHLQNGGVYTLFHMDRNERLISQLAADVRNKRPFDDYLLEQRTQEFIHKQALKLGAAADVHAIAGCVKDEIGKTLLKVDAAAVVGDTLLLGVADKFASPLMVQKAAQHIHMMWLLRNEMLEEGRYKMVSALTRVKRCQVFLVTDQLKEGVELAEVLEGARKFKVGVVLLSSGQDASPALDAPCMPFCRELEACWSLTR